MKKLIFLAFLFSLLSACASPYPLGMNEEQWNKLSPQERQQLLLEQQKYREEQRLAQIQADARARELRHKEEMAEKKRLEALYNNPANGNIVMVNILGGEYLHGKQVEYIREESYQLARGEIKKIDLILENKKKHYYSTETAYLKYAMNGNAVYLYLEDPKYRHNLSQRIALLRDGHWNCGSHYQKGLNTSYEKLKRMKFFVKESAGHCRHSGHPEVPRKIYR